MWKYLYFHDTLVGYKNKILEWGEAFIFCIVLHCAVLIVFFLSNPLNSIKDHRGPAEHVLFIRDFSQEIMSNSTEEGVLTQNVIEGNSHINNLPASNTKLISPYRISQKTSARQGMRPLTKQDVSDKYHQDHVDNQEAVEGQKDISPNPFGPETITTHGDIPQISSFQSSATPEAGQPGAISGENEVAHSRGYGRGQETTTNNPIIKNSDSDSADLLVDYKQYLKKTIESFKRYPKIARRRGDEGKVCINFSLDRSGNLLSCNLEESSGSAILDEAAMQAIRDAAPFSPPPVNARSLVFTIILDFRLSNNSQG